ncbi:MAG: efflux RND transporter periplasmic adaptor subunit [Pseudomonadales bacterium]
MLPFLTHAGRGLLALGLSISVLSACGEADPENLVIHQPVIAIAPELQDSYQVDRIFVGRAVAQQRSALGFELDGRIEQVLVREGDEVAAGDTLVKLDTRLLQHEKQQLEAELADARAQLKLALSSLERQQSLKEKGYTSAQRIDELAAARQGWLASIESLQVGLAANETRIEKSALKAPYAARVTRRYADSGAVLNAGQAVLEVIFQGAGEAEVGIPQALIASLEAGNYQLSAGAELLDASILSVGSQVELATRTVTVRFAYPRANIRDGSILQLQLPETVNKPGYWLPVSAVTDGIRGLWNVYLLTPDPEPGLYQVSRENVRIHHVMDDQFFVSGEIAGKPVVLDGLHRIVPGQSVRLLSDGSE